MRRPPPARACVSGRARTAGVALALAWVLVALPGASSADPPTPEPAAEATPDPATEAGAEEPGVVSRFLSSIELLPGEELFPSLLADPRWPRFSIACLEYVHDDLLSLVGAVEAGGTFALLRGGGPFGLRWDAGLQGGIFSIFDLDSGSTNLVDADYMLGGFGTIRREDLALWIRLFHVSSHLGDELILRGLAPHRINLSNDMVDALLSYEWTDWLRLYGGGGWIYEPNPEDLERGLAQVGLELRSPRRYVRDSLRPIAALDVKFRGYTGWHDELSLRGGLELAGKSSSLKGQLLLEYFKGASPNGQFFVKDIEYVGVGLHLFLL